MKKNQFILFLLFTNSLFVFGQNPIATQEINVPVQSVIMYLLGAEVTQNKQVTLNPGRTKIVFVGLSPKIITKSIQVNVGGEVSILAISDAMNYMANQKEGGRIKQLKDSATILNDVIADIMNDKDAYTVEKNMILKNDVLGGNEKGVAIAELKLAADFYRARIKEIDTELSRLNKKHIVVYDDLLKVNQQLTELNAKNSQPTAEVTILLSTAVKVNTNINLKYLVIDAGWTPNYDIHAKDINQPIELKYRAKVFNNTGVDWNDIKIKLSTADPSKNASKPILNIWELGYQFANKAKLNNSDYKMLTNDLISQGVLAEEKYKTDKAAAEVSKPPPANQPRTELVELEIAELSAEFDIKNNYTIPSDFKPYIVDVTEYTLPATYKHFSVPKLEGHAFLLARITGWEDLNLVEGHANIYYAGAYVGRSYIQTSSTNDTLDLSLGRDDKVFVSRTKVKEFCTKKNMGSTTKETFTYEILVKNNRKTPIQIDILDQLPISMHSDIVVDAIETSKGEFDSKTGEYKWQETLQPGEVKKIEFSFSVKYPKNSKINIQNKTGHMNVRFL